jgi:hypothetical protein
VALASVADATNLWHQRFGHLGTKPIVFMSEREVVLGIRKLEEYKRESLFALAVSWDTLTASFFDSEGGTGSIWTSEML